MKTNVRETSIAIYKQLQATGACGNCQAWIVSVMVPGESCTRAELSELTSLPINSICGRVNELVNDRKWLEEGDKRKCSVTGYTALTVRLAKDVDMKKAA